LSLFFNTVFTEFNAFVTLFWNSSCYQKRTGPTSINRHESVTVWTTTPQRWDFRLQIYEFFYF